MKTASNICSVFVILVSLTACLVAADDGATKVNLGKEDQPTVSLWLESSLTRVFPNTKPGSTTLRVLAARNSTVSFQACVRSSRLYRLRINGNIAGADGLSPRVRLVSLVPMQHFTPNTE